MHLSDFFMKGYQIYADHISYSIDGMGPNLEDYKFLQEYANVFLEEVPTLPPKGDIDFTINIVSGATSVSKAPYRMSTLDLM